MSTLSATGVVPAAAIRRIAALIAVLPIVFVFAFS
jgi:hypothetical protein